MQFGAVSVVNPNFAQVDTDYRAWEGEVIAGPVLRLLKRTPASGSPYSRSFYRIRLTWEDLTPPQKTQFDGIIDTMARTYVVMAMADLGIKRFVPPALGGGVAQDSAYVTLEPDTAPQYTYTQGYAQFGGVVYGPTLYKLEMALLGFDIQYLTES